MSENKGITRLLQEARDGNESAVAALYPLIYEQLRALAAGQMRNERDGHTLQPTALVNEAFLKLIEQDRATYQDRGHFMAVAATAMRRVLIDHARTRQRAKRGGDAHRIALDDVIEGADARGLDLLALDEAMERLATMDARKARIVELRFFAGLSVAETASVLEVSEKTVKREWAVARAWLRRALSGERYDAPEDEGDHG